MYYRQQLTGAALSVLLVGALTACSEPKREFIDSDFANATRFFCQKPNFSSSPLQGNSFVLYYDQETQLGNIGQFVYMGDYEWAEEVEEANPYNTDNAVLTDDSLMLYLNHGSEEQTLHVLVNRKTLDVMFDYKPMVCEKVDVQDMDDIKARLAREHREYKATSKRENKI